MQTFKTEKLATEANTNGGKVVELYTGVWIIEVEEKEIPAMSRARAMRSIYR